MGWLDAAGADPPEDADRYGRKLRLIMRDGESLGAALVDEGLADQWDGARVQ